MQEKKKRLIRNKNKDRKNRGCKRVEGQERVKGERNAEAEKGRRPK